MFEILSWLFFILFIGALIVVGGLLLRGYMTTGSPTSGITGAFFGPKPEKRIDVIEQFNVDGRRRLLLVRRDDVEHLIMTGGPVDVVIETGIGEKKRPRVNGEFGEGAANVYTRPPRPFGQAAAQSSTAGTDS
jgi:flagellar protein FliO/FliZ